MPGIKIECGEKGCHFVAEVASQELVPLVEEVHTSGTKFKDHELTVISEPTEA